MKKWLLILICILVIVPMAISATYYMPDDCANLHECFGVMSGGDTLIIRDGVYTGEENTMDWHNNCPPLGSEDNYTTIKAENRGKVVFDGEGQRNPVAIEHNPGLEYVIFDGLIFANAIEHCFRLGHASYVKVLNCGAVDSGGGEHLISSYYSSYMLYENCWGWGHCQYGMHMRVNDHSIVRRCVMRIDRADSDDPWTAPFFNYECNYMEWQNCITIDSDQTIFLEQCHDGAGGKFGFLMGNNGTTSHHVNWSGCLYLNNATQGFIISEHDYSVRLTNDIFWGGHYRDMIYVRSYTEPQLVVTHCLVGGNDIANARGMHCSGFVGAQVNNSLFYNIVNGFAMDNIASGTHNAMFGNNSNAINSNIVNSIEDIDPANSLKYLPRIEDGSDLDGAASDGGDIGATVLYKIGRSGTLWGEEGYNETTNEPLWPFPNEDLIKEKMSAYTYDQDGDGAPEITGRRGFCADGSGLYGGRITLTSYIWEYLGNPCPVDVCNYYDVNRDGHVNISDVQLVVNHILGTSTSEHADTTGDGSVNIQDVQGVVNAIVR